MDTEILYAQNIYSRERKISMDFMSSVLWTKELQRHFFSTD